MRKVIELTDLVPLPERKYTSIDWASIADGAVYELTRDKTDVDGPEGDFTVKNLAALRTQGLGWLARSGNTDKLEFRFIRVDEDTVRVQFKSIENQDEVTTLAV